LIVWRIKWYFVLPLWLTFSTFEGLYLSSALEKIPKGGWFTVTLAVVLSIIFSTWRYGKEHQWRGERRGRLPRLSKLVVKEEDGTLRLTQRFGSGEITGMKGKSFTSSILV
jgi:KUP system potassium uptake protein